MYQSGRTIEIEADRFYEFLVHIVIERTVNDFIKPKHRCINLLQWQWYGDCYLLLNVEIAAEIALNPELKAVDAGVLGFFCLFVLACHFLARGEFYADGVGFCGRIF